MTEATTIAPRTTPSERIGAVDALRGFDMIWIIGLDELIQTWHRAGPSALTGFLATQIDHAPWEGLRCYDLIFPLFIFLAGVALSLSLGRSIERNGRGQTLVRLLRRAAVLYLLGIAYYLLVLEGKLRLMGVLQRIAISAFFAGLVFVWTGLRGRLIVFAAVLVGYWAAMTYVPVPGASAGDYAEGRNLANYIDREYLPFFKWDGDHDPEGLLSNIPAIASCLYGVFAGMLLRDARTGRQKKVFWLLGMGVAGLALGYLWAPSFPIVKKIWTSSYVLVAGGYSCLLLACFYQVMEVWRLRAWATPFLWVGSNAITLYLASAVTGMAASAAMSGLEGSLRPHLGELTPALFLGPAFAVNMLLAWYLYHRRIFIRV
jgi:predicted acyltransferase